MKIHKVKTPPPPKSPLLPKETAEIADRCELLLSGVLGIDDYSETTVRIKTEKGKVEVTGASLLLCWAGEKRLMLRGRLSSVAFL